MCIFQWLYRMEGPRKKSATEQEILEAILNSSESDVDFEDSGSSFAPDSESEESAEEDCSEDGNLFEEADLGETVSYEDDWIDIEPEIQNIEFTGEEKISLNLPPISKPIDYFKQIFDDELVEKIVLWTNARADYISKNKKISAKSNLLRWKDVTADEIKAIN